MGLVLDKQNRFFLLTLMVQPWHKIPPGGLSPAGLFLLLTGMFNGFCGLQAQSDSLRTLPEVLIRRQQAERNGYTI